MGRKKQRQGNLGNWSDSEDDSTKVAVDVAALTLRGGKPKSATKKVSGNVFSQIADLEENEDKSDVEEQPAISESKASKKKAKKPAKSKQNAGSSGDNDIHETGPAKMDVDQVSITAKSAPAKKGKSQKKTRNKSTWSDDEQQMEQEPVEIPSKTAKKKQTKKKDNGMQEYPEEDKDDEMLSAKTNKDTDDEEKSPSPSPTIESNKKNKKKQKKKQGGPKWSDDETKGADEIDDDDQFGLKKSKERNSPVNQDTIHATISSDEDTSIPQLAATKKKKNKVKSGSTFEWPDNDEKIEHEIVPETSSGIEETSNKPSVTQITDTLEEIGNLVSKNKQKQKTLVSNDKTKQSEVLPSNESSKKESRKNKKGGFEWTEPNSIPATSTTDEHVNNLETTSTDVEKSTKPKKKKKTGFVWAEDGEKTVSEPVLDNLVEKSPPTVTKELATPIIISLTEPGRETPTESSDSNAKTIKNRKKRLDKAARVKEAVKVDDESVEDKDDQPVTTSASMIKDDLSVIPVEEVEASPFMQEAMFDSKSKKELRQTRKKAEPTIESAADQLIADELAEIQATGKVTSYSVLDEAAVATQSATGDFSNKSDHITATGQLLSNESTRDIQMSAFSLMAHGKLLVQDTDLSLLYGRRYGLVGKNACGKSTLLSCLGHREVNIQRNVDIFYLDKEYSATEETALEAIVSLVREERVRLQTELDHLFEQDAEAYANDPRVEYIEERLAELDLGMAEHKAAQVLYGLEFSREMMKQKTKEFSGGWRMRISLARALFVKPTLLLLDDPTSNLDMSACIWLEEYLKSYPHTLVLVSHSEDFLEGVCTDIVYMNNRKLEYYAHDYYTFLKVKAEKEEYSRKRRRAEEKQMDNLKSAKSKSNSVSAATAKQIKNKEKVFAQKRADANLNEIVRERELNFSFLPCGGDLPHPVVALNDVSFKYPTGSKFLFERLNFGIGLDCRIAIVGPNGVGKSTLLKLIAGALQPSMGSSKRNHHLIIARFHQHLVEQLNLDQSPVEFMVAEFAQFKHQEMRNILGRFGLTGKQQTLSMRQLSDGQKRRVVFAWLAYKNPHLLLLDEPSNNLDPETIDALAAAINEFDGATLIVSHDFRLLDQVADEIWLVENKGITLWEGSIRSYKEHLRDQIMKEVENL